MTETLRGVMGDFRFSVAAENESPPDSPVQASPGNAEASRCPVCGTTFTAEARLRGSPRRFCSSKCRTRSWRARRRAEPTPPASEESPPSLCGHERDLRGCVWCRGVSR